MGSQRLLFELWSWGRYYLPLSSYVAPFHGAPYSAAKQLLRLGALRKDDSIFDLGCGDGRLLTLAAQAPFGARGVGYELDHDLACEARAQVSRLGLESRIEIREADARSASVQEASVVFMYLSHDGNKILFDAIKPRVQAGTRLLTLAFPLAGLRPKLTSQVRGLDLYVYQL